MSKTASLSAFLEQVLVVCKNWDDLQSTTHCWFRGHSNKDWVLRPSVYREATSTDFERERIRDFKLRATAYLDASVKNEMELYFAMQHYGISTRLLDWTESYLTALFFAVEDESCTEDGSVWVLRPSSLNRLFHKKDVGHRVPMSEHYIFQQYTFDIDARERSDWKVVAENPIAVRPVRTTRRIIAQRGMFTLHGHSDKSLNEIFTHQEEKILEKIVICGESKANIKKELYLAGVCYSSLFPDLDGLSKEINYRYSLKYMNNPVETDPTMQCRKKQIGKN